MISKDMIYGIALLMIICGIIKAYILKIRLTPKDKILLTYTPTHLFFLVNILFVISSLNMLYVIFMKPNAVYQDWSHFYMASIIFIWYAIIAFGRRRYLKATKQGMKEFYFHAAVLISYASFFGFLYFN